MPPSFEEAVHLVSSDSAAGCVKQAGAKRARIRYTNDRLTSGPCDVDPERHLELRRAWDADGWRRPFGLQELRAAIAGDAPVVLWGTRAFADLVWIWWALDGLGRLGIEEQRLFLARPRLSDPLDRVGGATPSQAQDALAAARPVPEGELREGAELWRYYASPSPLAFDEARRRGSSAFPELTSSAELHGAWFPRLRDARLHLSNLDEVLLSCVDGSWQRPLDLLKRDQERLAPLALAFDAFFSAERLRAWAAHGALERMAHADDGPFEQDSFRVTDRARLLLDHGLEEVGDAPTLHAGGCLVNDPAAPWIRIDDDSGWRLALHGRP
jgi:hypothetical protein